jgi:phosphatidylglycerophosphatase A
LGAVLLYFVLAPFLSLKGELLLGLLLIGLGCWSAHVVSRKLNQKDPQEVVIDEIAGQWLALIGEGSLGGIFWRLVLFRLFDIFKPPPMRQVERLPGGWGIMADDLVAGLLANLSFSFLKYAINLLASLS